MNKNSEEYKAGWGNGGAEASKKIFEVIGMYLFGNDEDKRMAKELFMVKELATPIIIKKVMRELDRLTSLEKDNE